MGFSSNHQPFSIDAVLSFTIPNWSSGCGICVGRVVLFNSLTIRGIFISQRLYFTGWWFETFFIFPYVGNSNPSWLIFFRRGRYTANQFSLLCLEWESHPPQWIALKEMPHFSDWLINYWHMSSLGNEPMYLTILSWHALTDGFSTLR